MRSHLHVVTLAPISARWLAVFGVLAIIHLALAGCVVENKRTCSSASELLATAVVDEEVCLRGEVSWIGEPECDCFAVSSGGDTVLVVVPDSYSPAPTPVISSSATAVAGAEELRTGMVLWVGGRWRPSAAGSEAEVVATDIQRVVVD